MCSFQGLYVTSGSIIVFGIVGALLLVAYRFLLILIRTRYHAVHLLARSISGLSYHAREGDAGVISSVAQTRLSLRFPTPSNPHFCSVEFFDIRYYGPSASGRCDCLTANIRFPGLNQSWCTAQMRGLAITVQNSEQTPGAIERLRENIFRTIVLGKVQKLDHFFASANTRLLWSGEGFGVVAEARGYEVVMSDRTYKFGLLKGSLMRNWLSQEGRFTLLGENVRWYKAGLDPKENNKFRRIIGEIMYYPVTLFSSITAALEQPASLLDLEVTSGEIKFCKFRDRDHALEKYAMQFLGEWKPEWMTAASLQNHMWDAASQVISGTSHKAPRIGDVEQ